MTSDDHRTEPTQPRPKESRQWRIQFTLGTIFALITLTAVSVVLNRDWLRDVFGVKEPELLRPIDTAADLEEALNKRRAVVFIEVDWSLTSKFARRNLEQMIRTWRDDRNSPEVSFYFIDVTDRNPPSVIQQWMNTHPVLERATSNASGETAWLREGEVIQTTRDIISEETLREIGRATFEE